ncbi:MAG TPA: DMT family transporter [Azospirillaceae bacterium]|nr:DMT family transporter [Azospirillaceae bacterium]
MRSDRVKGIALFNLTILLFAVMDSLIKQLSTGYGTAQIVFFRAAFALLPLAVFVWRSGGWGQLRTGRPLSHVLRACVGAAAVFCFFKAFALLPLADVYALSFAAPLFVTALSVPLLKESVGWRRWAAVLVGFAGVLVMLRPGAGVLSVAALLPLAGAFFYALTMLYVRHLSKTETSSAIVFYFMATLTVLGGVAMLQDWRTPDPADFALLALVGIIGGAAQITVTESFRLAPPSVVVPFEYSAMLWAVAFGWYFFGEVPDRWIAVGACIVIASGLYIIHRETVAARQERAAAAA